MPTPELKSILLIDDNPNDRLLARRQLSKAFKNTSVQEVCNQEQFNRALAEDSYELVITDYQLGWSTGIEILKAVKQVRPECPIVMFTNTGTEEIAVVAMKLGLDDYVIKMPRRFGRLTQAVTAVWQRFQTELRANELDGRLQALINQLRVGIFRAAIDGELLDANPALFQMIGVDSIETAQAVWSEQLSKSISEQLPAQTENAKRPSASLASTALTQEIQIEISPELAEEAATPTRWLRISATLNKTTKRPVIDGLVEDVTARKQAQQSLQNMNRILETKVKTRTQQLERSNKELESFAYSVSHDLRAPIRQIVSFAGLIRAHLEDPPTIPEEDGLQDASAAQGKQTNKQADKAILHYLTFISDLAIRSESMIRSLLNLSRVGRAKMTIVPVDMSALVEQEIAQINRSHQDMLTKQPERPDLLETKQLASFTVQPLPVVNCDRILMQTVWQNLIHNALKFTQNQPNPQIIIGTISSSHTASSSHTTSSQITATEKPPSQFSPNSTENKAKHSKEAEETIFFIQDNGVGFAANQAEKIFGVFQRAHSEQDFGGTGIGLANVMRIVSRHEGRAWAEGEEGKGATFYFSLPKTSA